MNDERALRLGVLKVVSECIKQRYDEARAQAAQEMRRGDRLMARSPLDDRKIGAVSLSDPKPTAKVTSEARLREWIEKHYPESVQPDFEIVGSQEEVIATLYDHAPHLLRKITTADRDLVDRIKKDSTELGAPVGPGGEADVDGIEVTVPNAVVSFRADPDALGVVVEMFRSSRLSFEGLVQPEIEGGSE